MTENEKAQITVLRCAGYSYGEISALIGTTRSAVSNYCLRQQIVPPNHKIKEYKLCPNCEQLFFPSGRQRNNKQFCSEKCRKDHWRREQHDHLALEDEAYNHQALQEELNQLPKEPDENENNTTIYYINLNTKENHVK